MQKIYCLFFLTISFFPFPGKAQQNIEDSLNKVIANYKDEGEVIRAYNDLAFEYTRKYPAKARAYFAAAITIAKK